MFLARLSLPFSFFRLYEDPFHTNTVAAFHRSEILSDLYIIITKFPYKRNDSTIINIDIAYSMSI